MKKNIHQTKRNEILQAASKVFVKRGYFRTQMEDVAKESEVAKGTLYLYFKSKEELFASLFESMFDQGYFNIEKIKNLPDAATEKLKLYVKTQMEFCEKNMELFMMMDREFSHIEKTLRRDHTQKVMKKYEKIIGSLSEIIDQGIKERLIRAVDPVLVSLILLGIIKAFVFKSIKFHNKEKLTDQIAIVMGIFLKGVGAQGKKR